MPIYEYQCNKCQHVFDHLARTAKDVAQRCPQCGAQELTKQFAAFSSSVAAPGAASCSLGSCAAPSCASGSCPFG